MKFQVGEVAETAVPLTWYLDGWIPHHVLPAGTQCTVIELGPIPDEDPTQVMPRDYRIEMSGPDGSEIFEGVVYEDEIRKLPPPELPRVIANLFDVPVENPDEVTA